MLPVVSRASATGRFPAQPWRVRRNPTAQWRRFQALGELRRAICRVGGGAGVCWSWATIAKLATLGDIQQSSSRQRIKLLMLSAQARQSDYQYIQEL
jgi:hypothetical protein